MVAGTDFWLSGRESTALFFWDAVGAHVKNIGCGILCAKNSQIQNFGKSVGYNSLLRFIAALEYLHKRDLNSQ